MAILWQFSGSLPSFQASQNDLNHSHENSVIPKPSHRTLIHKTGPKETW
jgi:hypothetical protein